MKIEKITILLVAVFAAVSCNIITEVGSGNIVTEERNLSTISSVCIEGSADVEAQMGDTQSVTITTDDNIVSNIDTVMENEKLIVRNKPFTMLYPTAGIKVKVILTSQLKNLCISGSGNFTWVDTNSIQMPDLTLDISGSGNMNLAHVGTSLTTTISGSGEVTISGSADNADLNISGSGNYNAFNYDTGASVVDLSGSGVAYVSARNTLTCTISGSGSVHYRGSPILDVTISGSGFVSPD